jgi:hypothetical protein
VGALGVCFGAGHVVAASIGDPKIRSLATVAAWLHDRESLLAAFGPEYWTEGNHTDFYDRAPFVARAANAVAAHFGRTLR